MDERRDAVAGGHRRIFFAGEAQKSKQEGSMPFLTEQAPSPTDPTAIWRIPLLRGHELLGRPHAIGVGLDDRHQKRVPSEKRTHIMSQIFQMDGDQGTAEKHGSSHW